VNGVLILLDLWLLGAEGIFWRLFGCFFWLLFSRSSSLLIRISAGVASPALKVFNPSGDATPSLTLFSSSIYIACYLFLASNSSSAIGTTC
jgi:hypothetical protein